MATYRDSASSRRSSLRSISAQSHLRSLAGSPTPSPPTTTSTITNLSVKSSGAIYDKNLNRRTPEISLSAFSFLYAEILANQHAKSKGLVDLENRLNKLGYRVGQKVYELLLLREIKNAKRGLKIIEILQFVHTTVWRTLFGRTADELEKSQSQDTEYMLIDKCPMVSQFITPPKDISQLNCAAFMGGIIEAVLDSALFTAKITAHSDPVDGFPLRTVFLIRFSEDVVEREKFRFSR